MKKYVLPTWLLAILLFCLPLTTWAQTDEKTNTDLPPSYRYELKKKVPEVFFDFPDDEQKSVDKRRKTQQPIVVVNEIKQEIDFMQRAVCEKLPNGDKVYRLKFNCDAVLYEIFFRELQIPLGGAMYTIYPEKNFTYRFDIQEKGNFDRKQLLGSHTQSIIIEYVQPKKAKSKPKIITSSINLIYGNIILNKNAEEEQSVQCNPLIRCSLNDYTGFPISDNLKDYLETSVVKLRIYRPSGGCPTAPATDWEATGAFINNTGDRLLILTANHVLEDCYEPGSTTNPVKIRITFNYERAGCDEGSDIILSTSYPTGSGIGSAMDAVLLARNPDTDMALLEITELPEGLSDTYMASFNNRQDLPADGFGIHHPVGDYKRFSIQADYLNPEIDDGIVACNNTAQNTIAAIVSLGQVNINGPYFALNYDVGAPAGGSSGSPYFDTDGSIIGQLNGGSTLCPDDIFISLYGRLWYAWNHGYDFNNDGIIGADELLRSTLQPHLDPNSITNGYMPSTLCNYDLRLKDSLEDMGFEPNTATDNFFNSPAIINCAVSDTWECFDDEYATEEAGNTLKITVHNNSLNYFPTENAIVAAYWTIASTGETWPDHWIDPNSDDLCNRGDYIGSVEIPNDLEPGWGASLALPWTAPSYDHILSCLPTAEFLSPVGNNYQICYLARLLDGNDPIIGEQYGPIGDNVRRSNNIVTQNSFLIQLEGIVTPFVPVPPVLMLVENNNDFVTNLNVKIDKISSEDIGDLGNYIYLEVVLSQQLWDKWASTGFQGQGITIIDDQRVRVLDLNTAKLLNIPFDANEFLTLGIKATAAYTSGKKPSPNLPQE